MKFEHNHNNDFDRLLIDAERGKLGRLTEAFLRPAYYGTSLSGVGTGGYDGKRLVARLKDANGDAIQNKSKKKRRSVY